MDGPSPEQIARYRSMTPAERLQQAFGLNAMARRIREAHERTRHPDWTDEQVHEHVKKIFLRACTP